MNVPAYNPDLTGFTEYTESRRRPMTHSALGAALLLAGALFGFKGLSIVLAGLGGLFLLGGLWALSSRALGRNDRLRITHTALVYLNPARPETGRSVEFGDIASVSIGDAKVGRVKEIQVTVALKNGTKWTFGERFMDAALLQKFTEHLQEKIRKA